MIPRDPKTNGQVGKDDTLLCPESKVPVHEGRVREHWKGTRTLAEREKDRKKEGTASRRTAQKDPEGSKDNVHRDDNSDHVPH